MKKIIILILLLIFPVSLFAVDIKLSYWNQEMQSSQMNWAKYLTEANIKYKLENKKKTFSWSNDIQIKNTELGSRFNIDSILNKDLNNKIDIWGAIQYQNDAILKIEHRFDWKIGCGYTLINYNKFFTRRKTKISYGLIYRNDHLLHSFRLKDSSRVASLGWDFIINYILPNGRKNFNELKVDFIPSIKIFGFGPSFSYNYIETYDKVLFENKFSMNFSVWEE